LLAAGRSSRLSRSLWGNQAVQVPNNYVFAGTRENPHFSVDLIRIKTYYLIVRMEKVKVVSGAAGTKEANAES